VPVSALTGEGLDELRRAIDARLSAGLETMEVSVPTTDGAGLAWLYAHAEVLSRDDGEDAIRLTVRISPADRARFEDRA
jgi:GTP-binding protein HflX